MQMFYKLFNNVSKQETRFCMLVSFSWSLPLKGKTILWFFSQWYRKEYMFEIQDCNLLGTGVGGSGFLPRLHRDWVLWDGGGLQLHLWSGDFEPFAKSYPFSLQGGSGCYLVNWWGPIAHRKGVYLLEAVVFPKLLFWGDIVSGLETEWDLGGQWWLFQLGGLIQESPGPTPEG